MKYDLFEDTVKPNDWLRVLSLNGDELLSYSIILHGHNDGIFYGSYPALHDDGYLMIRTPEDIPEGQYSVYVYTQKDNDLVGSVEIKSKPSRIQR